MVGCVCTCACERVRVSARARVAVCARGRCAFVGVGGWVGGWVGGRVGAGGTPRPKAVVLNFGIHPRADVRRQYFRVSCAVPCSHPTVRTSECKPHFRIGSSRASRCAHSRAATTHNRRGLPRACCPLRQSSTLWLQRVRASTARVRCGVSMRACVDPRIRQPQCAACEGPAAARPPRDRPQAHRAARARACARGAARQRRLHIGCADELVGCLARRPRTRRGTASVRRFPLPDLPHWNTATACAADASASTRLPARPPARPP